MAAMKRRKRGLAASFVVTVAATGGCKSLTGGNGAGGSGGGGPSESGVWISPQPDGSCLYGESVSCPEGATCNPPAPRIVDCPPELVDGSAAQNDGGLAPPSRKGWVRVRPQLNCWRGQCGYVPGHFCPGEKVAGSCQWPGDQPLKHDAVPPDAGADDSVRIPSFVTRRADKSCIRYPEMHCPQNGPCKLPPARLVSCAELTQP